MNISEGIKDFAGIVVVQIEGFFTERFINLCKINNIKIWDVRQIVQGVIRVNIHVSDFKKLKPIAKKTKCKISIKQKKGLYFKMFKYRKKQIFLYVIGIFIIFIIVFSTFIWQIDITGNSSISKEEIMQNLKKSGVYIGRFKIGLSKKKAVNELRVNMPNLAWAGIEISGTTAKVDVVEKTVVDDKYKAENPDKPGDIIADKSGIVTKIIAENGTAKLKEGSYVDKGYTLIEGVILSKILPPQLVPAKGIVRINSQYVYEKDYKFNQVQKKYTGGKKYTIGISINNNENMLNYLNKNKKYDISKSSKSFNIFSNNISFDLYKCTEYVDQNVTYTKEDLINIGKNDSKTYIDKIVKTLNDSYFVDENEQIIDIDGGIKYRKIYAINERIGQFRERNS